jgi:FkbM family methyltransferase
MNMNEALVHIVRRTATSVNFNILEIGARPEGGRPEPFHALIHSFPGSRINAFEVDPELCKTLNSKATSGLVYHPVAMGRSEEERPFYETNYPMCASLYKPNEKLLERYNNMEVARLKTVSTIKTVSLDYFARENNLGPVDFIKIDIQGAELDVFQGGTSTLKDVVAIVTEVEFIHHYENQPLFGDVSAFLAERGFSFHKFLGVAGRSLKTNLLMNNPGLTSQHMWGDVMFIRDLGQLDAFSDDQLLKLAVLASMYGSPDVSVYCSMEYDKRHGTAIVGELVSAQAPKVGRNDPCPCGSGKRYKYCHGDIRGAS